MRKVTFLVGTSEDEDNLMELLGVAVSVQGTEETVEV
jgi:hypothetical protein